MTKDDLISAAAQLPLPPADAAGEYGAKSEAMAAELSARMHERNDLDALIGPGNTVMLVHQPDSVAGLALSWQHPPLPTES